MRRLRFLVVALVLLAASAPARAQLSDADRKAAARSAYAEGIKLQEDGKPEEALSRFEAAEKLFDAPTHLLHIAQCQAATGKLVEAQETYEVLSHKNLGGSAPEAFTDAQKKGEAELKDVRARIPTLRLTTRPETAALKNLQVTVNGSPMPNELLAIARPLNPGTYKVGASATGYKLTAPVEITLAEKEQRAVELQLVPGQGPPLAATTPPPPAGSGGAGATSPPAPLPPPYSTSTGAPAPAPYEATTPATKPGSSSFGLLLGLHFGATVPGGGAYGATATAGATTTNRDVNMSEVATAGGAFGVDASLRFARMLLAGATFEYGALGKPDNVTLNGRSVTPDLSSSTTYLGLVLGIYPNVDRTSFVGNIGVGRRSLNASSSNVDISLSGAEFALDVGIAIPVGPIRLVPKAGVNVGSFATADVKAPNVTSSGDIPNRATHTFLFVGLAGLWNLDLGHK